MSEKYKYDPMLEVSAETMRMLIREEIADEQWSSFRGSLPEDHITITRSMIPPPLELVLELAHQAFEQVKRAPGANCDFFTDHFQDIAKMHANANGGGYMACGAINGHPLGWHTYHHRVGIALTSDSGWMLFDVAFASRKNPLDRKMYPITPGDGRFNKLEMP